MVVQSCGWRRKQTKLNFFATDACLKGAGRKCGRFYFHTEFPQYVFQWDRYVHIAHLEMLAIIIGIKVWGGILAGKRFVIACDNQVVVTIINQSRSRNSLLQKLM